MREVSPIAIGEGFGLEARRVNGDAPLVNRLQHALPAQLGRLLWLSDYHAAGRRVRRAAAPAAHGGRGQGRDARRVGGEHVGRLDDEGEALDELARARDHVDGHAARDEQAADEREEEGRERHRLKRREEHDGDWRLGHVEVALDDG